MSKENQISVQFTQAELEEFWELVNPANQNGKDWKDSIQRWVKQVDLWKAMMAIEYFTATSAVIDAVDVARGEVLIYSPGYRLGPAGDH